MTKTESQLQDYIIRRTSNIVTNVYIGEVKKVVYQERFISYRKEMLKTGILFIYLKPQKHASNNDAIYKWLIN